MKGSHAMFTGLGFNIGHVPVSDSSTWDIINSFKTWSPSLWPAIGGNMLKTEVVPLGKTVWIMK